ncbi:hypothetical protein DL96DRAFT_1554948 [Flagelloscypha sp. PMI_526]|nr:hypothetical protein DL96DRAFT_1554948 [Flagelloscypha sp. PMI_526]
MALLSPAPKRRSPSVTAGKSREPSATDSVAGPAASIAESSQSRLTFPGVADLFIRLRRLRSTSQLASQHNIPSPSKSHHIISSSGDLPISHPTVVEHAVIASPPTSPAVPTTPITPRHDKESTPQTPTKRRISGASIPFPTSPTSSKRRSTIPLDDLLLEKHYVFICKDGVNSDSLLRCVRKELKDQAAALGANALVKEQWSCTISGPKHRKDGSFRAIVHYSASPIRTTAADPGRPVCMEKAKGVPGLMTVIRREVTAA